MQISELYKTIYVEFLICHLLISTGCSKTSIQKKYLHSCSFNKSYTDRHNSPYKASKMKIYHQAVKNLIFHPKICPPKCFLNIKFPPETLRNYQNKVYFFMGHPVQTRSYVSCIIWRKCLICVIGWLKMLVSTYLVSVYYVMCIMWENIYLSYWVSKELSCTYLPIRYHVSCFM